ncbi:MAG: hypothetical protein AAF513_10820 [Pseudomonadota bacterium]
MMRLPTLLCCLLTCAASTALQAKAPEDYQSIQREARILADILRSSMRGEVGAGVRLSRVESRYLAEQGVLINIHLNVPWISINAQGEHEFSMSRRVSIPEIPSMVEEILSDLKIDISPYQPEALANLRDLRSEQRQLRLRQREIRAQLREQRRIAVRYEDDATRDEARATIARLEQDLERIDGEYENLSGEIEAQYQSLRDKPAKAPTPPGAPPAPPPLDSLVARAVCEYGATLRTLPDDQYLTIALARERTEEYFAFRMKDVKACSEKGYRAEVLLDMGYRYESD